MKSIQLNENLRYIQLSDEQGDFGVLIIHHGNRVNYTIQIESREELVAAIESFQQNPVGTLV